MGRQSGTDRNDPRACKTATISLRVTRTVATPASGVGNYDIVPALNDPDGKLGNYTVTTNNGTLTITAAPLSVSADNQVQNLRRPESSSDGNIVGTQNSDNISANYSTLADQSTPTGNYAIVPSLSDPDGKLGNYNVTTNNGTLTIDPASLIGTADNKSRLYGQDNPPFTVTYSGFVNSENSSIVTGILVGGTTATTNSPVGSYPISASGQSAPNYTITYVDGLLTINPADLCAGSERQPRLRPDQSSVHRSSERLCEWRGHQCVERYSGFSTTADTNSPIGTYPIVPNGLTSTNYSITYSNGTLTVTPYALTLVADNKSRNYGAANPTLTGTLTGCKTATTLLPATQPSPATPVQWGLTTSLPR